MKISIRLKTAVLFIIVAVIGLIVLVVFSSLMRKQYVNEQANLLRADAVRIADSKEIQNDTNLNLISEALKADIWITDLNGNVLVSYGTHYVPKTIEDYDDSIVSSDYSIGRFFDTFSEDMLTVSTRITDNVKVVGNVFIHYPVQRINNVLSEIFLLANIIYGVMVFLIILANVLLNVFLFNPISKVTRAGKEFASGNLTYPLTIERRDEVGIIAESERKLAREVSNASDDQRKFLANVSHDFRSPLTSIKGYAVAIQDGTIPPELQNKYLGVVISEADRLTGLANGLLELNRLEKGIALNQSTFDVNRLIGDVLPTYEGRAKEKNIWFDFAKEENVLNVVADREKIEQVIQNLVDNALKFSEKDSHIDVSTRIIGEKAFISVKDYGIGIAREELSKIWNRFYKSDASRGKDKTGTGLGLSIVREIIQAHGEAIDVISTPGEGTEFIFTLTARN